MKSKTTVLRSRAHILIAEDDAAVAKIVAQAVREIGFRTHWAKDGVKAINWIFLEKPTAVILDLTLPRLDGAEICSLVRKTQEVRNTPIIVLSGHADTDDKLRMFELGADDYVTKPFSVAELVARLDAVLKRSLYLRPHMLFTASVGR